MSVFSSVVLALSVLATVLAVVRFFRLRLLLGIDQQLLLADERPCDIFAFATHYFFGVFVVCWLSTTTQSSVFLEVSCGAYYESLRLACFGTLALTTLIFLL
jgi:hypothetical protein